MIELGDKQLKIYNGLAAIGGEIASFYLDAVRLVQDENYIAKAYLLAHIAREIDGGLRDLLSDGKTIECERCKRPMHGQIDNPDLEGIDSNHLKSILSSLDIVDQKNEFANFWKKTATQFNRFAHRSGAYKEPRNSDDILSLWYEFEIVLYMLVGEYITQIEIIDRIVKKEPNERIILLTKNLIKDENRYRHFFNNLKDSTWLPFLFKYEFFNPENIPLSSENRYWFPMQYLTFVSEEIKAKRCDENLSGIIVTIVYNIIKSSSVQKYSEDIRLWYFTLKLFSNIPKKFISEEFTVLLPIIFNSNDGSKLTGQGLIDLVESYFVEPKLTVQDKKVIETVLLYAFGLSKNKKFKDSSEEDESIYPKVQLYVLKGLSQSKEFINNVVSNCSNDFILALVDEFEKYLQHEYISGIYRNSIFFDEDRSYNSHSIEIIYTDFFKGIFAGLSNDDDSRLQHIANILMTNRYNHFYIFKLIYYSISLNYNSLRDTFSQLLVIEDMFSNSDNHNDLYFLLEIISKDLESSTSLEIKKVIDEGSKSKFFYEDRPEEFRLYWYSALKQNPLFTIEFEQMSVKYGRDYESLKPKKQRFITWGSKSSYSVNQLSDLGSSELVVLLKQFDPPRGFDTPDSEGLANVLEEYITNSPQVFVDNYSDFIEVQFIYTTRIFYALSKALETKNDIIKWNNVLCFIKKYMSQDIFGDDSLKLKNDNLSYDKYSFIHASCRLVSKVNGQPSLSYSTNFIPLANEIFVLYLSYLTLHFDEIHKDKIGSPTHFVNSTNGIILEAFLMHLLRKARDIDGSPNNLIVRWESSEKKIFDDLYASNCREFFMLLGMYKSQLLFIDYNWTMDKICGMPTKDKTQIKSFFGTHIFSNDPSLPDYENLKEIYKIALSEDWELDEFAMSNSIERHISIFYLFNYEEIGNDSLMNYVLNKNDSKRIGKIIHFFSHYVKGYLDTISELEKKMHCDRIVALWEVLFIRLKKIKTDDSEFEISGLINFLQYIDEINGLNFRLIKDTALMSVKHWEIDNLFNYLTKLKDVGDKIKVANYILEIINDVVFLDIRFINHIEKDLLILIEHFYSCDDSELKKSINELCNQLVSKGYYFVKDLYLLNNAMEK